MKGLSKCFPEKFIGGRWYNLRYVIPHASYDGVEGYIEIHERDQLFNDFIYGYHYSHHYQLIEKKISDKGWEYMVYNKLDQVVAIQDSEQRKNNQWLINKYDGLGRIVMTGLSIAASQPDQRWCK